LVVLSYALYDVVEMKKPHPCSHRSKLFQIVRLGADVKITCLGCGNTILMDRDAFNGKIRRVISHHESVIAVESKN
jgi:hypothetical protein